MKRFRIAAAVAAGLGLALAGIPAQAFFHLWTFTEFFSNADGSVQFIELQSSGSNETVANGAEIRTSSGGNVFNFPGNLSGNTLNKRLLIATAGFHSLPGGVTPDFTLPTTSFFNPAGDTIRLFHPSLGEFHSRMFASAPTDGVMSLNYPPAGGSVLTNSPTNFAGSSGSVNLAPPMTTGDYNGNGVVDAADYTVWRDTLGQTVGMDGDGADGSGPGGMPDGVVDEFDYDFWKDRFGDVVTGAGASSTRASPSQVAVPEPAAVFMVALAMLMTRRAPRRAVR